MNAPHFEAPGPILEPVKVAHLNQAAVESPVLSYVSAVLRLHAHADGGSSPGVNGRRKAPVLRLAVE